ncbi:hypothetical protein HAX54_014553, partial [Datura stramonium]|nr:hypothetical protein [Datura stramonium]
GVHKKSALQRIERRDAQAKQHKAGCNVQHHPRMSWHDAQKWQSRKGHDEQGARHGASLTAALRFPCLTSPC